MNDRIHQILGQMAELEDELRSAVHDQESRMFLRTDCQRIKLERSVRQAHRWLKTGFFRLAQPKFQGRCGPLALARPAQQSR
jgi:hypothetical protein